MAQKCACSDFTYISLDSYWVASYHTLKLIKEYCRAIRDNEDYGGGVLYNPQNRCLGLTTSLKIKVTYL